jgi:succinate dehydrogenase assembly factor 1
MPKPLRLTGLQRQVLHFYRSALRAAHAKGPEQKEPILKYARAEFDRYRGVDRKNYQLIEHLLRKGKRQLAMLQQPDVTAVHLQPKSQ